MSKSLSSRMLACALIAACSKCQQNTGAVCLRNGQALPKTVVVVSRSGAFASAILNIGAFGYWGKTCASSGCVLYSNFNWKYIFLWVSMLLAVGRCLWTNEDNSLSELASLERRRAHQQNDKFRIFKDIWSAMPKLVIDWVINNENP